MYLFSFLYVQSLLHEEHSPFDRLKCVLTYSDIRFKSITDIDLIPMPRL